MFGHLKRWDRWPGCEMITVRGSCEGPKGVGPCYYQSLFMLYKSCFVEKNKNTGSEWVIACTNLPLTRSRPSAGVYAAAPAGKRVHTPGISPPSPEERGGQKDALPRFHHERMVSWFSLSLSLTDAEREWA